MRTALDGLPGKVLLEHVNEALDITPIELGSMKLTVQLFDLHPTVKGVIDVVTPLAQEKNLLLALDFDEGTDRRCDGDGGRMAQILINLVGNAIKFIDRARGCGQPDGRYRPGAGRPRFGPWGREGASDGRHSPCRDDAQLDALAGGDPDAASALPEVRGGAALLGLSSIGAQIDDTDAEQLNDRAIADHRDALVARKKDLRQFLGAFALKG